MAGEGGTRRTFSLRTHLLLLIVGTMMPALALAAFLARRVVADNRAAIEGQLLETARADAALADAELAGSIRALQGLAQSDRLHDNDIAGFYEQAQRLLATQTTWFAVSLSDTNGRHIANTERPFGAPLPYSTDPESMRQTVMARRPTIGNLRAGGITGQLGFPVRVPVARDGRVEYVLSAWIRSHDFAKVLQRQAVSSTWTRGVVDRAGVLVARSRDEDRFVGAKAAAEFVERSRRADEGVYRGASLEGVGVYSAFSRAPMSGWVAGVGAPASVVDAPIGQSLLALGAIAALLLGIGGTGSFLISRRIAGEIRRSTADAEALAGGLSLAPRTSRVTEVQRLVDALARSATLLATRQRERDEQVARADAARAEAEAADRAKDDFLAMLGHELRNPLAPALTALQLMRLKGDGAAGREREVVERQIRHMARLVDDLLDVSRLRRGTIDLRREPVDLGDVVARAVEMTEPLFTQRRHLLDVDVQPGVAIDADRIRLAQVVTNLLTNAAKYTEPGGHVVLRARADDGEAVIECRDSGIGMPADLVPRVFDLFVQGQRGLDRRDGGLGLGLAVARTLVELHGGRIEAASDGPQRGSTFTVRLPLARRPPAPTVPPPIPSTAAVVAGPSSGGVLIVDDNEDARDMLVEALRQAGLDAIGAADAAEALHVAATAEPRAAVLDIGLPEMNGFDLARALRARTHGPLRLIALTGYGQAQDVAAARAAGFDAFFVKPVDVQVLLAALEVSQQTVRPGVAQP